MHASNITRGPLPALKAWGGFPGLFEGADGVQAQKLQILQTAGKHLCAPGPPLLVEAQGLGKLDQNCLHDVLIQQATVLLLFTTDARQAAEVVDRTLKDVDDVEHNCLQLYQL